MFSSAIRFECPPHHGSLAEWAFVPTWAGFDDFLNLNTSFDDLISTKTLCDLLLRFDANLTERQPTFDDEQLELVDDTRQAAEELLQRIATEAHPIDAETLAHQLELGCHLYASMMATVVYRVGESVTLQNSSVVLNGSNWTRNFGRDGNKQVPVQNALS
jgi:hypothetical protein